MDFIEKYFWAFSTFLVPVLFLIIAPIFYYEFYFRKTALHQHHKIQSEQITSAQFRRELLYSLTSLIIFTISGFGVFLLYINDFSAIYMNISFPYIIYLPVSVVLMMIVHDMYFYWTHRLLHLPGWYQKIHKVHHLSSNPSPFTSLSFHPVEAVIQAAVLPLMVIIIPTHPFALFIFLIYMVYKNVRGHAGFEFTSHRYRQTGWHRLKGYSVHHNIHHLNCTDNYGLYFTIWDRLMSTFKESDAAQGRD